MVSDQASQWSAAIAAVSERIENGLCPRSPTLGRRRQLKNCATVTSPADKRCAVEHAIIVSDQSLSQKAIARGMVA